MPATFLLLPLLGAAAAASGSGAEAARGDRKAILDALRPRVEARVGPDIVFLVDKLKLRTNWAFIQAEPQRRSGRRIDGRRYFGDDWETMDGLTTTAILRKEEGRWMIVEARIGALDAWYCGFVSARIFNPC